MDASDKIYIAEHNANVQTGYFSRNRDNIFTQEYIRKDIVDDMLKTAEDHAYFAGKEKLREAILEMLDEAITHLSDGSLASYYESLAYQDIKEKIQLL